MDQLAVDFLQANGFEVNEDTLRMFGSFIAHSDQTTDTYDPVLLRKMIRKQIANSLTFYLVHPNKRPKEEKAEDAAPGPDNGTLDESKQ